MTLKFRTNWFAKDVLLGVALVVVYMLGLFVYAKFATDFHATMFWGSFALLPLCSPLAIWSIRTERFLVLVTVAAFSIVATQICYDPSSAPLVLCFAFCVLALCLVKIERKTTALYV